jgi:hypothetical protein
MRLYYFAAASLAAFNKFASSEDTERVAFNIASPISLLEHAPATALAELMSAGAVAAVVRAAGPKPLRNKSTNRLRCKRFTLDCFWLH